MDPVVGALGFDARPPATLDVDVWGKNLGVLWDGRAQSPLKLVHWLTDPMDARRGMPPLEPPRPDAAPLSGAGGLRLHGNGSPSPLGADCPGLSLSVGHVHTDAVNASRFGAARRAPSTVYVHSLVVWREADGAAVATSAPFCFAALGGARGACDLIQFVSGLVVADREVLLAYGTDDCAGAYVRLPLRSVVERAFRGDAAAAAAACPALSRTTN